MDAINIADRRLDWELYNRGLMEHQESKTRISEITGVLAGIYAGF